MKRMNYEYGHGNTMIFLGTNGEFTDVFDVSVEEERKKLLDTCGGRQYYTSRSGLSGAGYLEHPDFFVEVGGYRVDTRHPSPDFKAISDSVEACVPYAWTQDSQEYIRNEYPSFVRKGDVLVVCGSWEIASVLAALESDDSEMAQEIEKNSKIYERIFVNPVTMGSEVCYLNEERVRIKVSNIWGRRIPFSIWDFVGGLDRHTCVNSKKDTPFPFVEVSARYGAKLYEEIIFMGEKMIGTKRLDQNPLDATSEEEWPFEKRGFKFLGCCGNGDRLVSQFRGNDVRLIAWRKINVEGEEEKYIFAEESVNKLLFERNIKKLSEKLTHALDEHSKWYTKTTETASETNDATANENDIEAEETMAE